VNEYGDRQEWTGNNDKKKPRRKRSTLSAMGEKLSLMTKPTKDDCFKKRGGIFDD